MSRKGWLGETSVKVQKGKLSSLVKVEILERISSILEGLTCSGSASRVMFISDTSSRSMNRSNESPALTVLRCYRRGVDALRAGIRPCVPCQPGTGRHPPSNYDPHGWVEGPRIVSACRVFRDRWARKPHRELFWPIVQMSLGREAREELVAGADHLKIFITEDFSSKETFGEPQMTLEEMEAVVSVARSKNTYVVVHSGDSGAILKGREGRGSFL